jgi:hypothetical protein
VEALGVTGLLDRIGDRFGLLAGGDRTAPSRLRSLAATVEWSYQLLEETERRVFRHLSVFPGPFTLEAAEAVAGAGAVPAVLRLVDCSAMIAASPPASPCSPAEISTAPKGPRPRLSGPGTCTTISGTRPARSPGTQLPPRPARDRYAETEAQAA